MLFPSPIFSFINLWNKNNLFLAYSPPFSPCLLWVNCLIANNGIGLENASVVSS